MKKKSQEIAGRILAKRQELEQIFAAHKDEQGNLKAMPEAVVADVKSRQAELAGLKAEMGQATELEEIEAENQKGISELKTPQYNVPLGQSELRSIEEKAATLKAGEIELAGFRPAGFTYIETEHDAKRMQLKRLSVAYEEGELNQAARDWHTQAALGKCRFSSSFTAEVTSGV